MIRSRSLQFLWFSLFHQLSAPLRTSQNPPGILTYFLDQLERMLLVLACWFYRLWLDESSVKPAAVLFLLVLLGSLLRLLCMGWSPLGSSSQVRSETLGRGEPSYGLQALPKGVPVLPLVLSLCLLLNATKNSVDFSTKDESSAFFQRLSCFLILWSGTWRSIAVGRVMLWSLLRLSKSFRKTALQRSGWQGLFLSCEWHDECPLSILNIAPVQPGEPYPEFGIFQAVDRLQDGSALPLSFVCQPVGLVLHGTQSPELGGPSMEGPSSNERRLGGIRKRLVIFEACPSGLTDAAEPSKLVRQMGRYKRHLAAADGSTLDRKVYLRGFLGVERCHLPLACFACSIFAFGIELLMFDCSTSLVFGVL